MRELIAAGWEIDSHTLTHPDLTSVGSEQLHREVLGSRRALQRRFGVPAAFFSYPSGRFDGRVVTAVEAAGYLGATTTLDGLATPRHPFRLARIRIDASDGATGLADKLRGQPWP